MTKERYKKKPHYSRSIILKQWGLLLIVFTLGYFTASLYQFTNIKNIIMAYLLHQQPVTVMQAKTTAVLPPPKFEFYTLLAKDKKPQFTHVASQTDVVHEHKAEAAVAAAAANNTLAANTDVSSKLVKDLYLVQVASFRRLNEAERLKSMLVSKGIDVNINAVSQQGVQWYRVVMGPFTSKQQAQQAQQFFSQHEHTIGMIRRMDA